MEVKISLALGKETQTVTVEAGAELVESDSHHATRTWIATCSTSCLSKASLLR